MTDILDTLSELEADEELYDDEYDEDETDDDTTQELELLGETEISGDFSEGRAREITEAIRSAATATFLLLAQAHQHNAHRALGYETWADYVQTEFDMSTQRSYQLLDLSRVIDKITDVVPEGTAVRLTEAQARDIKRELPQVTESIRSAVEGGQDPDEAVSQIVDEIRDQKKSDDKAVAEKTAQHEQEKLDKQQKGLEGQADGIIDQNGGLTDNASDDFVEVDVDSDDASDLSPEDSMNLYNFFNILSGVNSLPEPDDFVHVIPAGRKEEIEDQLMEAVSWLNRFQTLWELKED